MRAKEVEQRILRSQTPVPHPPAVDQNRIYAAVQTVEGRVAAVKKQTPTAAAPVVNALQHAKQAQSGVDVLKAEQFSATGQAIYDSAGTGGGLVVSGAGEATLQVYTGGEPTADVQLQSGLVTISPALQLGSVPDVEAKLGDMEHEIEQLKIEAAATTAADAVIEAAQSGAIASLLAKVFPPAGYAPLDPELDPDPTDDGSEPNTQSLEPLTLAPKGQFETSSRLYGKVGVNNGFPAVAMDVQGAVWQTPQRADDINILKSRCQLGTGVATYDAAAPTVLTNPQTVCVSLGTNAQVDCAGKLTCGEIEQGGLALLGRNMRVTDSEGVLQNGGDAVAYLGTDVFAQVDGTLQAAKGVFSDGVRSSVVNGLSITRVAHAAALPAKNYALDIAKARLTGLGAYRRVGVKALSTPNVERKIAAARGAVTALTRRLKPALPSADYSRKIAAARSAAVAARRAIPRPHLLVDYHSYAASLFKRVSGSSSDAFAICMRRIKPVLSWHAAIAAVKAWCLNLVTAGAVTMANKTLAAPTVTGTLQANGDLTCAGTINASLGAGVTLVNGSTQQALYCQTSGLTAIDGSGLTCSMGDVSSFAVRSRVGTQTGRGFIWENANEQALMSLTNNTGNLQVLGTASIGGALSAAAAVIAGDISAASLTTTGNVNAAAAVITGDVSAGSVTTTGALNAGSVTTTGRVTADFLLANSGLSMNNSKVSGDQFSHTVLEQHRLGSVHGDRSCTCSAQHGRHCCCVIW